VTQVVEPAECTDAPAVERAQRVDRRPWYAPLFAGDLAALWPAIVVAFLGVLAIAFAMSYHGLFVLGERIMGWPVYLCIVAPIGLDVFSLVGLLATFLTRDAHWRVRLYCWGALLFTVALSIGGNAVSAFWLLDRVARLADVTFRWGYAQVSAVAFAAVWPVLSAVALHVLIVVRRHLDTRGDRVRQAEEKERAAAEAAKAEEDEEQVLQARAIIRAAEGASAAAIVEELGIPESKQRTYERLTKPIRDALAAAPKAAVAAKATPRKTTTVRTAE
jgi:hypothetical protein